MSFARVWVFVPIAHQSIAPLFQVSDGFLEQSVQLSWRRIGSLKKVGGPSFHGHGLPGIVDDPNVGRARALSVHEGGRKEVKLAGLDLGRFHPPIDLNCLGIALAKEMK